MKQISVFLENKKGQLAELIRLLSQNSINMRALSLADTTDFGILRLIVEQPDQAKALLEKEGYAISTLEVIAVKVEDKPGALSHILDVCAAEDISIEYSYAFLTSTPGAACLIIRTDNYEKTINVLAANNIEVASQEDIFSL